ncbi:MAG TPA: hypothetical protein VH325_00135 [Bryobacteraceae bacterium]|nr:hypothetical protein [Bryobacteraceae bacterium]
MKQPVRIGVFCLLGASAILAQRRPESQPYDFKNVKIVAGGFITGFVAHPTEPNLIYVRTDIGGTYRWNAQDQSWTPLTDFISPTNWNWSGTESIALDPNDPNQLYLAVGMYAETWSTNGGFLVSRDRGDHFTSYPAPFQMGSNENGRNNGERLAVNPFNTNELYFGTRLNGLWKSENQAQTWTQVTSFPITSSSDRIGVVFVIFDPHNSGVIYAGANQPNSIYKSADGGTTWTALPGQPTAFTRGATGSNGPSPMRAALTSNGILYVTYGDGPGPNGLNAGDVWKYDTAKNVWTNITPPLDPYQTSPRGGFCGLSVFPGNPNVLAVATLDRWYPVDSVYVSQDGGGTWVSLGPLSSIPNTYGNWAFPSSVITLSPWLTFGAANAKFGWWQAAILIDPSNANHLMYGTGATIYGTNNVQTAFNGAAPTWSVQAEGVEETAILTLISPTQGAHLLSGMGDIGGFRHDDFEVSPHQGMFTNPVFTTENGSDWAGLSPLVVARVGTNSSTPCQLGAYSSDQGNTWTPFPNCANGLTPNSGSAGNVAVSADGKRFVWSPGNGLVSQYSTDFGATWNAPTGLTAGLAVIADKQNPLYFYATDGKGAVYVSADGGQTYQQTATVSGANTAFVANYAAAGDLWLGGSNLHHSVDFGKTWVTVGPSSLTAVTLLALGMPHTNSPYQAIYVFGTFDGVTGVFRSTDKGASFIRVNDDEHQYGGNISVMTADPRVYGRYYLGTNGRGIIYGDPDQWQHSPRPKWPGRP